MCVCCLIPFVLPALVDHFKTGTCSLIPDMVQFCSVFVHNIHKLPVSKNRNTESLVCKTPHI